MKRFVLVLSLLATTAVGFAGCVVHDDHWHHEHDHDRVIIEDHHDDHHGWH